MKYFGYGSNLNEDDLKKWCDERGTKIPKLLNPEIKKLEDYTIAFTRKSDRRKGGVADIKQSQGDYCYGVIFDVTEDDKKILNRKEGVKDDGTGAYQILHLPNNWFTYEVVNIESDFVQPSDDYLEVIIIGAKNYGLPKEWIDKLESFKTR